MAMGTITAKYGTQATSDDGWPTTLKFSRQLGELHRGAGYARAVQGPYSRFSRVSWARAITSLSLLLLVCVAAQGGYLLLKSSSSDASAGIAAAGAGDDHP